MSVPTTVLTQGELDNLTPGVHVQPTGVKEQYTQRYPIVPSSVPTKCTDQK